MDIFTFQQHKDFILFFIHKATNLTYCTIPKGRSETRDHADEACPL